ncbi:4-amino-4-deoxychorismate lyase [Paenibacillus ihbetae]|uniref:4-amino-4-deoxychorismate lyase n=1 Tax=Paenibacillus ihbetae TaxID=1870820 RepID=A0A1B2E0U1_9BACL|nr:aminotransferase class IV [Paenibacillus ihbetae]ANY73575.1 4-amino-4-deoxychorismate lyase [Paenibacillus ihbetae]
MKFVGLNGGIVEAARAELSVLDHGLLYGMGAFETFRTYNGQPFLLERHLNRLAESCAWMGIEYQADPESIRAWITGLMKANGLADAYIRYTITAGEAPLGLPSGDYVKPAQILFAKALPGTNASLYEKGRALRLLSLPRNTPESPVRMKSLHYMNNILAKRELDRYPVHTDGPAEGLLLTAAGELAEGIVSNVFFVKDGRLYTPDLGTGILPGITRAVVMELAAGAGIRTEEGRYRWKDLLEADEIFTTGSVQEIVPVTTLIGLDDVHQVVGAGTAGPITRTLLGAYREKAGLHQ